MDKLMECPFCGEIKVRANRSTGINHESSYFVYCPKCGAEGPNKSLGSEAMTAWNTQPAPAHDDERMVDELIGREAVKMSREEILSKLNNISITSEPWEGSERILCINGKPLGSTFDGDIHVDSWWPPLKHEISKLLAALTAQEDAKPESLKCKVCKNGRFARFCENDSIPSHGDHGGPLVSISARYEDGTQISFGHEIMNKYRLIKDAQPEEYILPDNVDDWTEKDFDLAGERMRPLFDKICTYESKHYPIDEPTPEAMEEFRRDQETVVPTEPCNAIMRHHDIPVSIEWNHDETILMVMTSDEFYIGDLKDLLKRGVTFTKAGE